MNRHLLEHTYNYPTHVIGDRQFNLEGLLANELTG
jgi:hypothetical protein